MRPLAPRTGQRRSGGGREPCVLPTHWCRMSANGLQSRYEYFEVGGVISSGGLSCSGGPAVPPPGIDSASIGPSLWSAVSFNLVVSEPPRTAVVDEG